MDDLDILREDDYEVFERKLEERARRKESRVDAVAQILVVTPAVRGRWYGGEQRMALKTGELSDLASGSIRVTYFGPDGPHGHVTVRSDRDAAEAIEGSMQPPFEPMSDEEVIAWTSTPTFERGARIIAIVQAENTLRYLASRSGQHGWAADIIRKRGGMMFDEVSLETLDAELDRLTAAIRELPVPNSRVAAFVRNPAWVTGALADHYELLEDRVPPRWMPQLRHLQPALGNKILAELTEFGCGVYGCVLATNDPDTVLKITSDTTESEFATTMANDLVAPIVVEYRLAIAINAQYRGDPVTLLWREAADHVGKIRDALGGEKGRYAQRLIDGQHMRAQEAYRALLHWEDEETIARRVNHWVESIESWLHQDRVPELWPLARGLLKVWRDQHVFFGDIHSGNLGFVPKRNAWVITDPGNIAVIENENVW